MHHYWDYISRNLSELETVKFVNFYSNKKETQNVSEKALLWVLLALYHIEDLEKALVEIVCDHDFLLLYKMDDSYMWQHKKDVIECLGELKKR